VDGEQPRRDAPGRGHDPAGVNGPRRGDDPGRGNRPVRRFADLTVLEQSQVGEALEDGRAVDDPDLAPAALERARAMQRGAERFLMWSAGVVALVGVGVWAFGDGSHRAIAAAAGIIALPLGGAWVLHYRATAIRAAEENAALLGEGEGARPPGVGARIAAAILGLWIGSMTARWAGFGIVAAVGAGGRDLEDLSWYWQVPLVVVLVVVAYATYRAFTDPPRQRGDRVDDP
jgi:hypothetical protein